MAYAEKTSVPVERSRAEIEKLCKQHGASSFSAGWLGEPGTEARAAISFVAYGRMVRFELPLPSRKQAEAKAPRRRGGYSPSESAVTAWLEQEQRRRWRALGLTIKAKLTSVEEGIETFEQAFLAHIVPPGSTQTIYQALTEGTGRELKLLPPAGS